MELSEGYFYRRQIRKSRHIKTTFKMTSLRNKLLPNLTFFLNKIDHIFFKAISFLFRLSFSNALVNTYVSFNYYFFLKTKVSPFLKIQNETKNLFFFSTIYKNNAHLYMISDLSLLLFKN